MEEKLIEKTFYQTLLNADQQIHPIKQLGELFLAEQSKELPDASYIRFSQGEVYFHHKDYEAAIYKWENVHNELEPWAKKNIADAYYQLELYSMAEELYRSVQAESSVLKMEVLLNLYHLYMKQEQYESADQIVKEMVALDPDYPNVTELARTFYENLQDWKNAVDLAIQEGVRTESDKWYHLLAGYVQKGYTNTFDPKTFISPLTTLYRIDPALFEQLVSQLWKSYENTPFYLKWLTEIISFFPQLDIKQGETGKELPQIFCETYDVLTSGTYSVASISDIMPGFLRAWLDFVPKDEGAIPAAALFAWNERVPAQVPKETMEKAEKYLFVNPSKVDVSQKTEELFNTIETWAKNHQLEILQLYRHLCGEMKDVHCQYTGVISLTGSEKSLFINSFLNEYLLYEAPSSVISLFKHDEILSVKEIAWNRVRTIQDLDEYQIAVSKRRRSLDVLASVTFPNRFLKENRLALIDIPDFSDSLTVLDQIADYVYAMDSLIYLCDGTGVKERDLTLLKKIQQKNPGLFICCVFASEDGIPSDSLAEQAQQILMEHELKATVYLYTNTEKRRRDLARILNDRWKEKEIEDRRLLKYVYFMKKIMENLLHQRAKMENQLLESVQRKEDLSARIKGAIHQLKDMEGETAVLITQSYGLVKEDIKRQILQKLPELLKEAANSITEDRDFYRLHEELNDEMNGIIRAFITNTIQPKFSRQIQEWLVLSEEELKNAKTFMDDINEGFRVFMGERKLNLQCDFQIIDDWRRDINRLMNRIQVEEENILTRYTPQQMVLKGAGKVLDLFKKDKSLLIGRYQHLIEGGNYEEVARSVADKFLSPFAILEKGIGQDVSVFFKPALDRLAEIEEDTKEEIADRKRELEKLKENPETFHDPLTFFEVRRMQYEFLLKAKDTFVPVDEY